MQTDNTKELIRLYTEEGAGTVELGAIFNLSHTCIQYHLKKNGVTLRSRSDRTDRNKVYMCECKKGHQGPSGTANGMYGRRGSAHHNWKGGNRRARPEINTSEYRQWRKSVFVRDNYTCQDCGIKSAPGIKVVLNAHHIKPWIDFPDLRYDIDNGTTFCIKCHQKPNRHKWVTETL